MLSRWTDFLTSDGEKSWRKRDEEFEEDNADRAEVLRRWEEGWVCLFKTLNGLTEDDMLTKQVLIRNEKHSVAEAINRQLAHYPYHVGQLVYLGKMMRNDKWTGLSMPKKTLIK